MAHIHKEFSPGLKFGPRPSSTMKNIKNVAFTSKNENKLGNSLKAFPYLGVFFHIPFHKYQKQKL